MKLVVEYRILLKNSRDYSDTGWMKEIFDFSKVGPFKKPEFHIRNLSVKIISFHNNIAICHLSDGLILDSGVQDEIDYHDSDINVFEYRENYRKRVDFVKSNGKFFSDKVKGTVYTEFPVTYDKLAMSTSADTISYQYIFYLEGSG